MDGQWCTIESDPNTFRELATKLGVVDVQFEEIFDLDSASDLLSAYSTVYGFVFLFKWTGVGDDERDAEDGPGLFIKQNVTNSCATISVLHIALNSPDVQLDEKLQSFKDFVQELPADMRGLALTNSHDIRQAHNSFIAAGSVGAEPDEKAEAGDAFHFVAIIPGAFLMDGMREAPVRIGDGQPFTDTAIGYIKGIMERTSSEIRFSLLAMVPDQLKLLEEQLSACTDESIKAELRRLIRIESDKRKAARQDALPWDDQDKLKRALEHMAKVRVRSE